jgi:hypothetical protein
MLTVPAPAGETSSCNQDAIAGKLLQQLASLLAALAAIPPSLLMLALAGRADASGPGHRRRPGRRPRSRRWQMIFASLPRPAPSARQAGV